MGMAAETARTAEEQDRLDRFGAALAKGIRDSGRVRTQADLGKAVGFDQTTVSSWKLGKKAPAKRETVVAIERALGPGVCPPGSLQRILYGAETDPPPEGLPTPRDLVARMRELLAALDDQLEHGWTPTDARAGPGAGSLRSVSPDTQRTGTRGKRSNG